MTGGWTLVVLGAGAGSRYGGPKQLEAVGPSGEVLADYTIWDAHRAGAGRAVFVIRPEHEPLFRDQHARWAGRIPISYVHQRLDDLPAPFQPPPGRSKPWGTTHAVLAAAGTLNGPFAVANADDRYGAEALRSIAGFLAAPNAAAALVSYTLGETLSSHGGVSRALLATGAEESLVGISEVSDLRWVDRAARVVVGHRGASEMILTGDEPVSLNLWAFTSAAVRPLRRAFGAFLVDQGESLTAECQLPVAVDVLVGQQALRVRVLPGGTGWFGITHAEDLPSVRDAVRRLVERGEYPERL